MQDTNDGRTEVDNARVSIYMDGRDYPMVVPTDDDVTVFDLGDLVSDRIEANGLTTLPDMDDRPDVGESQELGTVYWDNRGIPTRLIMDDKTVHFTENGGVDTVESHE